VLPVFLVLPLRVFVYSWLAKAMQAHEGTKQLSSAFLSHIFCFVQAVRSAAVRV
jgi:hypothetical protein